MKINDFNALKIRCQWIISPQLNLDHLARSQRQLLVQRHHYAGTVGLDMRRDRPATQPDADPRGCGKRAQLDPLKPQAAGAQLECGAEIAIVVRLCEAAP